MEFESVIKKRKSVRNFKNKSVPWREIMNAIEMANQGPYSGNHNHIRYLITEDAKTIKELSDLCGQTWIGSAKTVIVVCSDDTHLENLYGERGRVYSRQQAGAAIKTLMLALTNGGIDSCWVGSYSDELVRNKLKIPGHIQIEAIIPTGFGSDKTKKPAEKEIERSIFWEKWGSERRPSLFEEQMTDS